MVPTDKKNILFLLEYKGEQYPIRTAPAEFPSLMSLISQYMDILGFGLCSGMGSCGTCLVSIRGHQQCEAIIHTLSCDIPVNDQLANTTIIIPEGHY